MTTNLARLTAPSVSAALCPSSVLAQLADVRAFIMYRLEPRADGKLDKMPTSPLGGGNIDAHNASEWMLPSEAAMWAEQYNTQPRPPGVSGYGVGVVISEDIVLPNGRRLFALDIDGCRDGGAWAPHAAAFLAKLSGAGVEVSISGHGLHAFGTYSGPRPEHGTRNKTYRLELYSRLRFIACTGINAVGDCLRDLTAELHRLAREYFPPHDDGDYGEELTTAPVSEWVGPADDDELLRRALQSNSGAAVFGEKASFADLFEANEVALARAFPPQQHGSYDASAADLALANWLAFFTGNNGERMLRLMQRSKLARSKWERPGYLHNTIQRACASTRRWYKDPRASSLTDSAVNVPAGTIVAPASDDYVTLVDRTDAGNANLLIRQANGTLRYVAETSQWLQWTGTRWQLDEHEVFANASALEVAKLYMSEARRLEQAGRWDLAEAQTKWATKCRNRTTLDAMLVQARKVAGVPISVKDLDRDPWLLGVENGVVDLRTGELRADARDEFITKRCRVRYNPDARAPRWEAFIAEITGAPIAAERRSDGEVIEGTVGRFTPRPELAHYLHKALGCSITGSTDEQKFFIAIGDGSNGKSVVFDTVKSILGPYAVTLPSEAFLATARDADSERPTALAASLAGARLVVASETKDGQRLDISVIKNHTGDREMTARRMRENPVTFTITHKPWLSTNVRPALDHMDPATRGRLHLIPFDRRWNRPGEFERDPALPDGDKELATQLAREAEGILAWLVRGAVLYKREGLAPPQEVVTLTRDYVLEQDHFGHWLSTLQRCPPREGTYAAELFNQFGRWCSDRGYVMKPANTTAFGRALAARGVESVQDNRGKRYGVRGGDVVASTVFGKQPLPPNAVT